jgi:hypothetical protein
MTNFQGDWELKKYKNGIRVYTKHSENSSVKSFKGVTVFNVSLNSLVSTIRDLPNYPAWLDRCESGEVLKIITEDDYYIHTKMDMPFPVADRDIVQHVKIHRDHQDGTYIELLSEPNFIPEVEGYLRVPFSAGYWLLSPENENSTRAEIVSESDPGGSLPTWVINMMIVATPYSMLRKLDALLENEN